MNLAKSFHIKNVYDWYVTKQISVAITFALALTYIVMDNEGIIAKILEELFEYAYLLDIYYAYIEYHPKRRFGFHICCNIFTKYFSRFFLLEIVFHSYDYYSFIELFTTKYVLFIILIYFVPITKLETLYKNEFFRTSYLNLSATGNASINIAVNSYFFSSQMNIRDILGYYFVMAITELIYYIPDYIDKESKPKFDYASMIQELKYYTMGATLSLVAHFYLGYQL